MAHVKVELVDRVAVITLDRPEARNAVDRGVAEALEDAIDQLESDPEIWAGVLAANGPVFCAGADLKAIAAGDGPAIFTNRGGFAGLTRRQRSKPLIAAVEGPAVGGGVELALACDLIVASTQAEFVLPELQRGLLPTGGALDRLPRALPQRIAVQMVLSGEPLSAQRAHDLGLVWSLAGPDDACEHALTLAKRICGAAPVATREALALMSARGLDIGEGAWARLAAAAERVAQTADFAEGPAAFLEGRAPRWSGR